MQRRKVQEKELLELRCFPSQLTFHQIPLATLVPPQGPDMSERGPWGGVGGAALHLWRAEFSTKSENPRANKGKHSFLVHEIIPFSLLTYIALFLLPFRKLHNYVCGRELEAPSRFCWTVPRRLSAPQGPP